MSEFLAFLFKMVVFITDRGELFSYHFLASKNRMGACQLLFETLYLRSLIMSRLTLVLSDLFRPLFLLAKDIDLGV